MVKKDFVLGILLIVFSQFFLVGASALIAPAHWYILPLVMICSYLYVIVFSLGYKIAFEGVKIDVS
jgi:hypothetical protein